jgi:hypothetical protein
VEVGQIIAEIDLQISKLQQARALLSESGVVAASAVKRAGRGRPKGSKNGVKKAATKPAAPVAAAKPRRKLSAEARNRIREAQKKRWAERHKEAAK